MATTDERHVIQRGEQLARIRAAQSVLGELRRELMRNRGDVECAVPSGSMIDKLGEIELALDNLAVLLDSPVWDRMVGRTQDA